MSLRLSLLLGATMLVLGTVVAACGGDERLTLEEFFQRAQAISDDFEERKDPLYNAIPDEGDEENEENLAAYEAAIAEFPVVYAEFYDELGTLNPPSEAESAFDELLAVGSEQVELFAGFADSAEGVQSFAEIQRIVDQSEVQALEERYRAACLSLQDIADANGIVASIDCAEGAP